MADTEKLKDMLDNLINGKPEQAQVVFHDYLKGKLNGALGQEVQVEVPPVEPAQNTDSKE